MSKSKHNIKSPLKLDGRRKLRLSDVPTKFSAPELSDEEYDSSFEKNRETLEEIQNRLYACSKHSVLIIFQGMDTSGKDGAIKHVMSGVNPQGCSVTSFKTPTSHELDHDFLWKANQNLPARGQIGIFNRSYYEEILITQVHPELLEKANLPDLRNSPDTKFWKHRYDDILNYEKHLHRQGYEIIKIFIHISKDEQKRRLLSRFEDPKKLWKIAESDILERSFWSEYQAAYEKSFSNTSSKHAPWYVVPGDNKKLARLAISEILVERLEKLDLKYPELNKKQKEQLKKLHAMLK